MMPKPKVSVIVPVYQPGKELVRLVQQLLCQFYQNREIILVNNGPSNWFWRRICEERDHRGSILTFDLGHIANSYASRTGRPAHVGVIGVALFREQPPVPSPAVIPEPYGLRRDSSNEGANSLGRLHEESAPTLPSAQSAPAAAAPSQASEAELSARSMSADSAVKAAPMPSAKLGTAHGQRETSVVSHTSFTRLQNRPNEVITIRYDSRENLIAAGVIREPIARPHVPRAFPHSDNLSYVPDPR
jgi:hypothetical protein